MSKLIAPYPIGGVMTPDAYLFVWLVFNVTSTQRCHFVTGYLRRETVPLKGLRIAND